MKGMLELFFMSASKKIDESKTFLQFGDLSGFTRDKHALKGLAFSLHMNRLGELAAEAERGESLAQALLQEILGRIEAELQEIRKSVDAFYQGKRLH